jgi:hypothetical protein
MRVFKTKRFAGFAQKEAISDRALKQAVTRLDSGEFDADLGAGIFKQRLARPGSGKSGGYRVIVCFKKGSLSFFVYGFAKSDQANISQADLRALKKVAKILLALTGEQLVAEVAAGRLYEI